MNRVLMNRCRRCVTRASALVFRPMRLQAVALSTTAVDDDFVRRAALKDREMRSKHFELKEDYPKESFAPGKEESTTFDEVYRKRLIYRAKQRGWLEVDLLLGSWATKHVHSLTEEQCREFEELLKVETLDIYNFIIGKDTPPDAIASNSVLKMLQDYTKTQPLGKASPEGYAKVKPMMSN